MKAVIDIFGQEKAKQLSSILLMLESKTPAKPSNFYKKTRMRLRLNCKTLAS